MHPYVVENNGKCHKDDEMKDNIREPSARESHEMAYQRTSVHYQNGHEQGIVLWLKNQEQERDDVDDHEYLIVHSCAYLVMISLPEVMDNSY